MVFRVDAEGAWTWKQRAAERQMRMQEMFEVAAELFALIPLDQVEQVRAYILSLKKRPYDVQDIADRAVIAATEEEARAARAVIDIIRDDSGDLKGILNQLIETANARNKR